MFTHTLTYSISTLTKIQQSQKRVPSSVVNFSLFVYLFACVGNYKFHKRANNRIPIGKTWKFWHELEQMRL